MAVLESDLPSSAKLLALAYESFGGVDMDRVWVAPESLRRRTSMSNDTIVRHRKKLVDGGWLELVTSAGHGYSARYRLVIPRRYVSTGQRAIAENLPGSAEGGLNLHDLESEFAVEEHRGSDSNSNQNNDHEPSIHPIPQARPSAPNEVSDDEVSSPERADLQPIDVAAAKREARLAVAEARRAFSGRRG